MNRQSIAPILLALTFSSAAVALAISPDQTSVGPATSQPALNLLGAEYSDPTVGIALRPPRDCSEIHEAIPDEVVQFRLDQKSTTIRISRIAFEHKTPLESYKDSFGQMQDGLLKVTLDRLQHEISTGTVTRNEAIQIGKLNVGMLAMRFVASDQKPRLIQQAIVESPFYPHRMYYVIEMSSPGAAKSAAAGQEDPAERDAFDTFTAMLDTVRVMNLTKIADDQEDRLIRTRALFYTWNQDRLRAALVPEQRFRLIKDGKDMGYVYEVQEIDPKGKVAGTEMIKIGLHAVTYPQAGVQVESETWMFSTVDMKHENWSTVERTTDAKGKLIDQSTELGRTDETNKAVALQPENGFDAQANSHGGELGQGNLYVRSERVMDVKYSHKLGPPQPMSQELPAFYIPLAIGQLLPKIVPLTEPKTYMFAVYVADSAGRQVKARYLDVGLIETVNIDGKPCQAIPIKDRIGLEGALTTHYISPDGVFLESLTTVPTENGGASTFIMLPTDADTLNKLWEKPDLSRPTTAPAEGN